MPEGFNSVADLRVIVDANADKFHSGVQGVMSVLDGMGAKGGQSLGGLDQILTLVGDTALGVRGKMNLLLAGVEQGVQLYQQFAQQGRAVAEALGVTSEYDRLKAAIDDLGMSLQDSAVGAFFALQSAGMDAASTLFSFSDATAGANDQSQSFAATLLDRVTSAIDSVRLNLRLLNADMATNAGSIDTTIGLLDSRVAELQARISRMHSGEEQSKVTVWNRAGKAETDLLAQAVAELNSLLEKRNALMVQRSALPGQDWIDGTTTHISLLGQEIASLEQRNATLGMSAAAAAEYNAVQRAMADAKRQNIALTEDEIEQIRKEAAIVGALTAVKERHDAAEREAERSKQLAAQRERSETQVFANADREIANLRVRAETIGLNARETAELTMRERLLQQLRASGNEVSEAELVKIRALAAEYGRLTETVSAQQTGLRRLGEIGQTVSGTLASAFAQWTRGAELDVKNMVASMLNELAQLTFRRGALEPLFGGGMGGQGSDGGLFSSLLGSIFGGFREGGGDVEAGKAYVVGEKRAELFIPGQSGTIAPSVGGARGGEIHVYVHGTEDFDARVESTAEGVVARQAPSIVQAAVASSSKVGSRTLPGQLQNHQRRGTQ